MNPAEKLDLLDKREAATLDELQEIQQHRRQVIREMQLQSINLKLNRKQVARLLEYNYSYMSRLNIPFRNGQIFYLALMDWVAEHKPGRKARLEKNFRKLLTETK